MKMDGKIMNIGGKQQIFRPLRENSNNLAGTELII